MPKNCTVSDNFLTFEGDWLKKIVSAYQLHSSAAVIMFRIDTKIAILENCLLFRKVLNQKRSIVYVYSVGID